MSGGVSEGAFGVKGGVASVTFRKLAPHRVIDATVRAGLEAIEWGGDVHVPPGNAAHARDMGRATRDAGLAVSSYGSYYVAGEGQEFAPVLDAAVALGAPVIRIWAGRRPSAESDAGYRSRVVCDVAATAALAHAEGVRIALELHGGTLTDELGSARNLLEEIAAPNAGTYWQPPVGASVEDALALLGALKPWLVHLHVFHWSPGTERRPLVEGRERWRRYLHAAAAPGVHVAMLEFVRDDSEDQFMQDAAVLKELIRDEMESGARQPHLP